MSNIIIAHRGQNIHHILDFSSGTPRLHQNTVKRFILIQSQPQGLSPINPFEFRCALCHSIINYPVWHYDVRYIKNHLHYFICANSLTKPTAKCYKPTNLHQ